MKKTKLQIAQKLNLNKNQITTLTIDQANNVAGGGGTSQLITFNALCELNSSKIQTRQGSYCICV